jgi:phage gp46-like protein
MSTPTRYDGDVALTHTADGGAITFRAGQPDMEQGLFTAVYISLETEPGWWGNSLASPEEQIGSGCPAVERGPLTNKARLDYEEAARQALAWMIFSGLAKTVTVEAAIIGINALGVVVTIEEPDETPLTYKYRVNWQEQRAALGVS